jgi:hypothetical protein
MIEPMGNTLVPLFADYCSPKHSVQTASPVGCPSPVIVALKPPSYTMNEAPLKPVVTKLRLIAR